MDQLILEAEPRTILGKQVKQLRREGLVPAVIYGKATAPVQIQLQQRPLELALTKAGEAALISLKIAGETELRTVLVREQQRHVLTQAITHVDFYAVVMTEKLRLSIPLTLVGEPPVLEQAQGILLQPLEEVEVECLPGNLVSHITVDVTTLKTFDDAIHVRDLVLPPGIEVLNDLGDLVATTTPIAEEKAEELEAAPVEAADVEVVKKGKKEEEEAED
jgi:large subunit ribosomal protein L25